MEARQNGNRNNYLTTTFELTKNYVMGPSKVQEEKVFRRRYMLSFGEGKRRIYKHSYNKNILGGGMVGCIQT